GLFQGLGERLFFDPRNPNCRVRSGSVFHCFQSGGARGFSLCRHAHPVVLSGWPDVSGLSLLSLFAGLCSARFLPVLPRIGCDHLPARWLAVVRSKTLTSLGWSTERS